MPHSAYYYHLYYVIMSREVSYFRLITLFPELIRRQPDPLRKVVIAAITY